jgi:hypothetical protein
MTIGPMSHGTHEAQLTSHSARLFTTGIWKSPYASSQVLADFCISSLLSWSLDVRP